MPKIRDSFPKRERLCNIKAITSLFESGKSSFTFPLKIYYKPNTLNYNRIVITVPKRNHKKAVDRNLIKRRIRESWRLYKGTDSDILGLDIAVVYVATSLIDYKKIEKSLKDGLAKIKKDCHKTGLTTIYNTD